MAHTIVLVESDGPVVALARRAFDLAGVPWDECHAEDRGALALVLVPEAHVLDRLPLALVRAAREAAQTRLRVVVHAQHGQLTSSAVDTAFRFLRDHRFTDLVTEAVDVGIVEVNGAFPVTPTGAVVHRLADARVFLLSWPLVAMASAAAFRLTSFPEAAEPLVGGGPSAVLRAADRVVPFFGREDELARLESWRDEQVPVSVLLLHGPGGQGKTRVAAEFATRAGTAGWLTVQALHEPVARAEPASGGLDGAEVLIVVDYAERWPRPDLTGLLQHVMARRPARLRVLLVARQAGYWWKALANPLLKAGATVSELGLGVLAATVDRRRVAFAAARDRFAELLGVAEVQRLRPIGSLDDDAYGLALTLHMSALVVVDAHGRSADLPADPGSLSTYLLRREQDHWQTMVDHSRITTQPDAMARVVAIATLTQSLPQVDAEAVLVEVGLAGSTADARTMVDDHALCYPPHGARVLAPLLPDRLGEDFLAESLPGNDSGGTDPWTARLPPALITATAAHAPAALSVLVETADRWEHVRRDHLVPLLTSHPALVLRAEGAALVTLAGFADHDLLVALTATLPDRHVELDGGIAALARKLTDFGLARTHDEAKRARLYEGLAARLSNAGLYEDAVTACREVIAIRRRLAEVAPEKYEPGLADALGNVGIDLWHAGLVAESVTAMREAVDIYRRRADDDPDTYADDLAAELTNLTGALIGMDSYEEALAPAQEAVEIFLRLSETRAALDIEVASAQRNLAIVLGRLDRHAESLPVIESAVSRYRRLAEKQPQVHAADLAEALHTLGNRLAAVDRVDEALDVTLEGVDVLRRLVAANPAAHERAFVMALSSLTSRLWNTGDQVKAIATDEEAVHIARRWDAPSTLLGKVLNNLTRHLDQHGDHVAALVTIEEAITTWRALEAVDPGAFGNRLARALEIRDALAGRTAND
ncbi:MAG: tetratricopeptide repeat protein [Umezawaea sp.]